MCNQYKIFIFQSSNVTIGDTVETTSKTVEMMFKELNQKKYAIKTFNGALEWTDSLCTDNTNTLKTVLKRKNKNLCLSCNDSRSQGKSVVSERNFRPWKSLTFDSQACFVSHNNGWFYRLFLKSLWCFPEPNNIKKNGNKSKNFVHIWTLLWSLSSVWGLQAQKVRSDLSLRNFEATSRTRGIVEQRMSTDRPTEGTMALLHPSGIPTSEMENGSHKGNTKLPGLTWVQSIGQRWTRQWGKAGYGKVPVSHPNTGAGLLNRNSQINAGKNAAAPLPGDARPRSVCLSLHLNLDLPSVFVLPLAA